MTDTGLANWGARYGITLSDVKRLQRLIDRYAKEREHFCNGDPHYSVADREDKNANSQAWDKSSDVTGRMLSRLARTLGFTGVDFGVGLYPVLEKDGDTCIMVPDSDQD